MIITKCTPTGKESKPLADEPAKVLSAARGVSGEYKGKLLSFRLKVGQYYVEIGCAELEAIAKFETACNRQYAAKFTAYNYYNLYRNVHNDRDAHYKSALVVYASEETCVAHAVEHYPSRSRFTLTQGMNKREFCVR